MAAVTELKSWSVLPGLGLVRKVFILDNTTDAADAFAITLTDHGISATGLLAVSSWVHTTDGSVITTEANTVAVSAGVATVTIVAGTDNDTRIIEITGRSDVGAFA